MDFVPDPLLLLRLILLLLLPLLLLIVIITTAQVTILQNIICTMQIPQSLFGVQNHCPMDCVHRLEF
jgi:hypothetical protein